MSSTFEVVVLEKMIAALPGDPDRFQAHCGAIRDWERFAECAERHRLAGVIYRALRGTGLPLPSGIGGRIKRYFIIEKIGQERLYSSLDRLLLAFHAGGIRAVALKGPVLADRVYPDPHSRLCGDLDFLVHPEDLSGTTGLMRSLGYREEPVPVYVPGYHYHLRFHHGEAPPVEIHYALGTGFHPPYPPDSFIDRASMHRTGRGTETFLLSPEDELIFLSLHAAKHAFSQLVLMYDLKLFLLRHPNLDGAEVRSRSRTLKSESALMFTSGRMEGLLDPGGPDRSIPHVLPDLQRTHRPMAHRLSARILASDAPDRIKSKALRLLLCDDFKAAIDQLRLGLRVERSLGIGRYFSEP
jgi:hypothetical protein